ncbi:MAG TPA: GntR family transcriptional regulator [Microlunatus sp.]
MTPASERPTARQIPAEWTSAHPRADRARELVQTLRDRILGGEFADGSRLDETSLIRELGVSRNTVREALAQLRQEGLIERKRGAGTTVRGAKYGHGLDRLAGLAETLDGYGTVRNRVLAADRLETVPSEVAEQLGLDPEAGCIRLERLRCVNDEPLSLDLSYLPADIGEPLLTADLVGTDVFRLIEQLHQVRLGRAEVTVHAANADDEVASVLELRPGDAIFMIERLTRLADGRPVDVETLRVRADRFALQATIHRDQREPR